MATLVLQLLVGLVALAATIWAWWANANNAKNQRIADEDKKIDSANGADDIMRDSGELHNS